MIDKVTIHNFLRFRHFHLPSAANINLIIGENDTGKTGLLRVLYSVSKSLETASRGRSAATDSSSFKRILSDKLDTTFQPRNSSGIGSLVTRGSKEKLDLEVTFNLPSVGKSTIHCSFSESARNTIGDLNSHFVLAEEGFNALFIPAKEVLTALRAIKFTREPNDLTGFDDTYLDLIRSLEIPTSRGGLSTSLVEVNKELEALFEGEVKQTDKDDGFIFRKGNQEFPMSITAEGVKKIGILTTLIRNRQLRKGTILFMDEPETALHPKAIRALIGMLVHLSNAGIQIFITSHNYFVTKQLAIYARKTKNIKIQCCSLKKTEDNYILPVFTDMRDGLPENPIIDAALEMFDEEVSLDFME